MSSNQLQSEQLHLSSSQSQEQQEQQGQEQEPPQPPRPQEPPQEPQPQPQLQPQPQPKLSNSQQSHDDDRVVPPVLNSTSSNQLRPSSQSNPSATKSLINTDASFQLALEKQFIETVDADLCGSKKGVSFTESFPEFRNMLNSAEEVNI
eukprot:Pgem_evm2s3488